MDQHLPTHNVLFYCTLLITVVVIIVMLLSMSVYVYCFMLFDSRGCAVSSIYILILILMESIFKFCFVEFYIVLSSYVFFSSFRAVN